MKKINILLLLIIFTFNFSAAQNFWQQTSGPNVGEITGLSINTTGTIFAATNINGIRYSTNNGVTWTASISGLSNTYIKSIILGINNYIYAGTAILINGNNGIFRSTNNGNSWTFYSGLPSNTGIYCFAVNKNNGKLFAGAWASNYSNNGVYVSDNNGQSWYKSVDGMASNTGINSLSISNGNKLLAGTSTGVYLSTNDGSSWNAINGGLSNLNIRAVLSTDLGIFLAGIYNGGIFISTNNGISWTQNVNGISNNDNITSFYSTISNSIFASSSINGVFRSNDNGNIWIAVNSGLSSTSISSFVQNSSQYLFCGEASGYVYKSSNTIDIKCISKSVPNSYCIFQNYPNPFNSITNIRFDIPKNELVSLRIYDILGNEIETLLNEKLNAGTYEVDCNASEYPSGVYFYRLQTNNYNKVRKMILIK